MPIPKGTTYNPHGAPDKQETLTFLLRKYLNEPHVLENGEKKLRKQIITEKVFQMAVKGDIACMKMLWDRIEGPVLQKVDHTSKGEKLETPQIVIQNYGDKSN